MRAVPKVSVVAVMTLMVLAGCDSAEDPGLETSAPTRAPATSSPDETVATTSTPSEAEPEDVGQQAAAEAVVEFWAMWTGCHRTPTFPFKILRRLPTVRLSYSGFPIIESRREEGISAGREIRRSKSTEVETVNDGQRYEVTACLDWSDVRANGEKPERGDFGDLQEATYVVSHAESARVTTSPRTRSITRHATARSGRRGDCLVNGHFRRYGVGTEPR